MEDVIEKDMTPKLIGETYLRKANENSKQKEKYGLYKCQYCGKEWEVMIKSIKNGNTKSCGCSQHLGTHNLTKHRFFNTYANMYNRCYNSSIRAYYWYGGRGITICEEWLDITNFIHWAEETYPHIEGYTLDRIDVNKEYSPDNCRWTDRNTQAVNKRTPQTNTSGFVGVFWNPINKNWRASLTFKNEKINLGSHKTKEEAVQARDSYIIENNLPHKLSTDYVKETK